MYEMAMKKYRFNDESTAQALDNNEKHRINDESTG